MSKIHCNVIEDLMPSYIDNICSKESKILVEEHLQKCEACQKYKHRISEQDIKLSLVNNEEIDFVKKIRRNMNLKAALSLIVIFGISTSFAAVYLQENHYIAPFFGLLPILLICNHFMFLRQDNKERPMSKKYVCIHGVNLILVLYMPFLMLVLSNNWIESSRYPFGLREDQIGLFVHYQLLIIMIAEIIIWIGTVMIRIKKTYFYSNLSSISIIGVWLALYYIQMTHSVASVSEYLRSNRMSIGILVEGFIIMVIICIIERVRRKTNSHVR